MAIRRSDPDSVPPTFRDAPRKGRRRTSRPEKRPREQRQIEYFVRFLILASFFGLGFFSNNAGMQELSWTAEVDDGPDTEPGWDTPKKRLEKSWSAQKNNYRQGTALMVNVHVGTSDNSRGTDFCDAIGRSVGNEGRTSAAGCKLGGKMRRGIPWQGNETLAMVNRGLRRRLHMVAWEFADFPSAGRPLSRTQWTSPRLLSVVVMAHPMARILADPTVAPLGDHDAAAWARILGARRHDNLALRVLGPDGNCCRGEDAGPKYLGAARALLEKFTYVLDAACLREGVGRLAEELGVQVRPAGVGEETYRGADALREEETNNPGRYQELLGRNAYDVELYEWSKTIALVRCQEKEGTVPQESGISRIVGRIFA